MTATAVKLSSQELVTEIVRRIFAARSIHRPVGAAEDLREAGLTSLDMVNLVLCVEAEFNVQIPETKINPTDFRSIAAIDELVASLAH